MLRGIFTESFDQPFEREVRCLSPTEYANEHNILGYGPRYTKSSTNETSFQIYVHQHDRQTHELIYITDLDTIILFSLSLKKVVENYLGAKKMRDKDIWLKA